jgi:hypothetical protein
MDHASRLDRQGIGADTDEYERLRCEMQEQVFGQLVQALQDRAGLDAAKAEQVAQVVADFAQQHAGDLLRMATGGGGGEGGGGMQDILGKIMGR